MRYALGKLVQLVVVLVIVTFLTFMLINLLPGGPEAAILGFGADDESIAQLQEDLSLNDPIPIRYARWLGDAVTGDLGQSYVNGSTVSELLGARLPVTLALMTYAMFLALLVAVPFGIATAWKADTRFDKITGTVSFALLSVPNFIMATLLVYLFAINQDWFPATVKEGDENLYTLFLPALSLALGQIAVFLRLLRTDMIATLQEDYIGVAKAKGMTNRRILFRHAFRPSSFSLLTVAGITIGNLIGGTVIIEQIFGINGIGKLIVFSIFQRDYLVVQGVVVVIAAGFVIINFAVDLLYALLDPRIRHARAIA
ncbi:MAG: ABC transporter permease [Acidimicrobiales bacterium]|nr:ABC transporter permease [Acidimicrobiales bacterium]MCB1016202.1 ABC transporter permease [Acidimicrobiales bacterium]MCB9373722.1 ABC transporter permease [Microthrixaceae bacterium]